MEKLNIIGFDTRFGFRTTELMRGDMAMLSPQVDVLVVSAFADSYSPTQGTLICSLLEQHGIDARVLETRPALDFRGALGVWLSEPLETGPAKRLLFVEIIGGAAGPEEALDNVFAALMAIDVKRVPVASVAMPLLGAGAQQLDARKIANLLLPRVRDYLERSHSTTTLQFVEIDANRASLVSQAMDDALGRVRVSVPHEELAKALRADTLNRFLISEQHFPGKEAQLRQDWMRFLLSDKAGSTEFGVLARKLVEALLNGFAVPPGHLHTRIRALEQSGKVPPWTCGYMHVLRHLGNDAAHVGQAHAVTPSDLVAGLYCVQRLLDHWIAESPRS